MSSASSTLNELNHHWTDLSWIMILLPSVKLLIVELALVIPCQINQIIGCIYTCLVRFNRTQVRFPPCGSFGQVWIQQSHSSTDQTSVLRPSWRGCLSPLPNELWYNWMLMTLSTRVVLFIVSGSLAKRAVWKRTAPTKKINIYLARIKASELVDFPGVNTPLETSPAQIFILLISFWRDINMYSEESQNIKCHGCVFTE